MTAPTPTRVHYHRKARELEIGYADGHVHLLPVEYLRVYSPSAEVRGHGGESATLHTVMEHLLEEASFKGSDIGSSPLLIDRAYVDSQLAELAMDEDLSRYILQGC